MSRILLLSPSSFEFDRPSRIAGKIRARLNLMVCESVTNAGMRPSSLLRNTLPTTVDQQFAGHPAAERNRTSLPEKTPDTDQMPTETLIHSSDVTSPFGEPMRLCPGRSPGS